MFFKKKFTKIVGSIDEVFEKIKSFEALYRVFLDKQKELEERIDILEEEVAVLLDDETTQKSVKALEETHHNRTMLQKYKENQS